MAEVSYLLHPHDNDDDDRDDVVVTLPYWSHDFEAFASDPDFPPSDLSLSLAPQISTVRRRDPDRIDDVSVPDSISTVELFDRENQVNFVIDLFHQRVEQSSMGDLVSLDPDLGPISGVIEGNKEMGSTPLELDLGLGLGFCTERHSLADDDGDDHNCGFLGAICDDEFFVSRRGSVSESGESSIAQFAGGLRVVGVVSDSEEDENEIMGVDLNVEDDYEDEDFEWEEVDDGVDEREVLSMFFDADVDEDLDVSVATVIPAPEEMAGVERGDTMRNLEWEVLLNVHNLDTNVHFGHDGEPYLGEHDEYNYTAEYEMLFGQFAENENALIGRPPASKTVLENLPSVVLTQEDVENDNALCAVCKDGIIVGEQAKQLPCSHRYHRDCIVPWLGIRNTCPVCRYELPTDDPDYERNRTQRAGGRVH
ncbi:RING/U-box superfamily protein [Actinidia rufa]|uniref:RING-type E3 ubiquitin transferase n=1 Tax=Actinidia rufa TaxID=165716 RepID=A0A7J0GA41_9ERIC|nr:RING/U-box superfamily protein [Actinidia rufa]